MALALIGRNVSRISGSRLGHVPPSPAPGKRLGGGVRRGDRGERVRTEAVERKLDKHFNSMIQQRCRFPQMVGCLLLTYTEGVGSWGGGGGGVGSEGEEATQKKKKNHPRDEQSVNQKKGGDQSFRPKWDRAKALLRLRQANIYDITTSNQSGCTI